ncbi:MAG: zinc-ribbon domain-containing protein [Hyphomonas sp.]|uniref:zinc-ribbon domain-containing protein n=1 Tax=Hyphomonas sp. TaxID=87 RepID=UPI0035296819
MILTCPSCETQYFADDSTIGESGRTVKCAACGHSWFVGPTGLAVDAASPASPVAAHEIYRERVREQRRQKSRAAALISWLVMAAAFFSLGVAAIVFRNDVVKVWPQAAAAYKLTGFTVNRFGIEFEAIERSRTFNDTIPVVTVSGRALNVARTTVETPLVKVELMDERGRVVATKYGSITPARLQPGAHGTFQVVLEQAPMESFEIELSLEDKIGAERPPAPVPAPEPEPETEVVDVSEDSEGNIE